MLSERNESHHYNQTKLASTVLVPGLFFPTSERDGKKRSSVSTGGANPFIQTNESCFSSPFMHTHN